MLERRFFAVAVSSFIFFFFQAEDGIRDPLVTGVQTCALPICSSTSFVARYIGSVSPPDIGCKIIDHDAPRVVYCAGDRTDVSRDGIRPWSRWRSEERRVGKECRCRWSRGQ